MAEINGVGFDVKQTHAGLGLDNIRSWAKYLNADMYLAAALNKTSTVGALFR